MSDRKVIHAWSKCQKNVCYNYQELGKCIGKGGDARWVESVFNTNCPGIYKTSGIDWDIFHLIVLQCIGDQFSSSLVPWERQKGQNSCWAHKQTFTLAVKADCWDIINSSVSCGSNMVLTPLIEKQTIPGQDEETVCSRNANYDIDNNV